MRPLMFLVTSTVASVAGALKEAPSISADGQCLYYHVMEDGRYRIYLVLRLAKAA